MPSMRPHISCMEYYSHIMRFEGSKYLLWMDEKMFL